MSDEATAIEQAQQAFGLENPTLSYNLNGVADYEQNMQFLNLMDMARPWIGHLSGRWGGMSYTELADQGYTDENGWITHIPDGTWGVGTIWTWADQPDSADERKGVYVLSYEGEGTLELGGDARIISQQDGQIVFENMKGESLILNIKATDPNGTGDYIRDIEIVAEKNLDLYEAGQIFNPDWLEIIKDARELRFMPWNGAVNPNLVDASDLSDAGDFWRGSGAPVEYMVQLANEVGAEPWFTMPYLANEDYIRRFAEYVRDNLDPGLKVHVEYANEAWNPAFKSTQWAGQQSKAEWGEWAHLDYYAKKSVETAQIWDEVFGTQSEDRLSHVLSSQAGNPWVTKRLLNPEAWERNDPDGYVDPATIFDELAITTYFGSSAVGDSVLREDLISRILASPEDAADYLTAQLLNPEYKSSIPRTKALWEQHAELAHEAGLRLTAYEGGQHVHHSFAVSGLTVEQQQVLDAFFTNYVRSEDMAKLYQASWDAWKDVADGPYMQLGEVSNISKYGSWGLLNFLTDSTPRSELLNSLNENTQPWWDASGGTQYQQGVIKRGTDGADLLVGTSQEDYLLGGKGDDRFVAGKGNDGINGGDGNDTLILTGSLSDYDVRTEGDGYRIRGAEGSDFVIHVENLSFEDGKTYLISDIADQPTLPRGTDGGTDGEGTDPNSEGNGNPGGGDGVGEDRGSLEIDSSLHQIIDAAAYGAVEMLANDQSKAGIRIEAIQDISVLGHELGLRDETVRSAYASFDMDATIVIDGKTYAPNYCTLQTNTSEQHGERLAESATQTVLSIGSVVTNTSKFTLTDRSDRFMGRGADDIVFGGDGNDVILTGSGNDTIEGGRGVDRMWGGDGNDHFIFTAGSGRDYIYDFKAGDTLGLDGFLADNQNLSSAFSMADGNLVLSNGSDTIQFYGLTSEDLDWMLPMA